MLIAFVGQKGGAGKSTLAVHIGAELATRGRRVLLVDADPQGTVRTWGEIAAEAGVGAPAVVAMGATMHKPGQLDGIASAHDYTLIDCPPRLGDIQRSALMIADLALLPCGPSPNDAWALASSIEQVQEAQIVRPNLRAAIVLTKVQPATRVARATRAALSGAGLPVFNAELSYRVVFQEAMSAGQGATTFAPADAATREVRALLTELMTFGGIQDEATRTGDRAA